MKKILTASLLFMSSTCFGGAGQALIPYFLLQSNSSCHLTIINISDNDVTIDVDFFDQNGSPYRSNLKGWHAFAYSNPVLTPTILPAKKTGAISLNTTKTQFTGFGYISWQNDKNQNEAVSTEFHCNLNGVGQKSILINGQMPF